jgi:hypothetical protein
MQLFSPVFDHLSKEILGAYASKKNREIGLLGLDYGIEFVLTIIGLIFLMKYFAKKWKMSYL